MKKVLFGLSVTTLVAIGYFSTNSYSKTSENPYRIFQTTAWNGNGDKNFYQISFDNNVKHSGKRSICISSKKDKGDFSTLIQSISAENYLGKRLRLSAYIKSEKADQVSLWMRIDDKASKNLQFDNMDKRPIKNTTDWKKYEVTLDIPAESNAIVFGGFLAGKGKAWFDDFNIEVVDKSVPSTNMLTEKETIEPQSPKSIANISFEN